jgi:hypothetical protein
LVGVGCIQRGQLPLRGTGLLKPAELGEQADELVAHLAVDDAEVVHRWLVVGDGVAASQSWLTQA